MSRSWGRRSLVVRNTLCVELVSFVDFIITEVCDVSLLQGHRNKEQQEHLYPDFTKLKWPDSKHNSYPSLAVDLQPYPYPLQEAELREQLAYIAGRGVEWAKGQHIILRWGGDWNRNGDITDTGFDDLLRFAVLK